jgi:orotate phosphoribosyltransferase
MSWEERKLELQKNNLLILKKHKQPQFSNSWFPYTSGQIGPYYIQSVDVEKDGEDYHTAILSLTELVFLTIGNDFDVVSGGESRDWDFSNPVAYELCRPHAKLYKDFEKNKPLGADMKDKRIIHVADLQNEGSSIEHSWFPQIKKAGGRLVHAFFYVDRLEDGVEVMKRLGIPSDSVVPLDKNAWQILLDSNYITRDLYDSLNRRLEDKTAWAHNALRTHIGQLEGMLSKDTTREKAEKILNVGYPEIKDELLDRLKQRGYVHEFVQK